MRDVGGCAARNRSSGGWGLRLVAVKIRTDSCWHFARLRGSSVRTCNCKRGAEPTAWPCAPLPACSVVLALGAPAHGQAAQANWWESLTGSGTPDYTGRRQEDRARDRAAQQDEPLDDLRPDAMPMRSDEMIAAMDAAIAKYQQIADNGGWPIIPPGRMMREGEDDERVPLLRRRLQMSGDLRAAHGRLQLITRSTAISPTPCAATSAATACVPRAASSARPIPRST